MKKVLISVLVMVLAVALALPATTVGAVVDPVYIYGTERFTGDIYEIDVANGTYSLLVDISTISVSPAINPIGSSSPNGNALDPADMRFYFASFLDPGSPPSGSVAPSELYFVDIDDDPSTIVHAGTLAGHASDASFYDGSYWYVGHGTDELRKVTLNPDGTIASETITDNDISSGIANTTGYLGFGDIAFDLDGMLYVSATLRNSSNTILRFPFGTYDMTSDTFTDLGNNSGVQVAFGSDGVLYGHSAGLGEFYTIDTGTGAMSAPIFDHNRLFTDLASGPREEPSIEVDKDYRYTDVCFEKDNDLDGLFNEDPVEEEIDNDGDGLFSEDPVDFIDNDGDGLIDEDPSEQIDNDGDGLFGEDDIDCPLGTNLGDPLPTDVDGNYQLEAVVHPRNNNVRSYNPGQYYAVSTVNVLVDIDMLTIVEDWSECTVDPISALNPPNGGGSVVIVQVGPDGVAYQILDAHSPGVTVDPAAGMATAVLGNVSAGTTILMYVKFGPGLKGETWEGPYGPCENFNKASVVEVPEPEDWIEAFAYLIVVAKD